MSGSRAGPFPLPPGAEPRSDLPEWGSDAWHAVVAPQNYAFYEGIDTLYKYRAFATDEDERRVREILERNTVYFAARDRLNDTFDMAVRHEITGDRNDPTTRERVLGDLERLMRAHRPPLPEEQIRAGLDRTRCADLAELEGQATEQSRARLAKEFPIFCLASDIQRPAQWAYYAGDNTGLCIHFDARLESRSPFAFARRVEYQEARPALPIPLDIDSLEVARRVALIKHSDWDHEREYRLLAHPEIDLNLLEFDGSRGRFAGDLMVGITVGHRMEVAKVEQVRQLAQAHDPPIQLFRANPRPDTFSYSIDPI